MEFKTNEQLEDLYKQTAWHFEAKTKKKGSSYDWFKQVRINNLLLKLLGQLKLPWFLPEPQN